jgi:hypothetical protein
VDRFQELCPVPSRKKKSNDMIDQYDWLLQALSTTSYLQGLPFSFAYVSMKKKINNWCVPFGTQRVETEGVSMSRDIEINP